MHLTKNRIVGLTGCVMIAKNPEITVMLGGKVEYMASENKYLNQEEMPTRILPKNYRQIGEPGNKKIYMEDYVYTYLNKLAKPGNIYARGAILFGGNYKTEKGVCLFINGACACQNFEFDLENATITEETWKEIYHLRDQYFEAQEVVGWFLSRMGFSVELNDKIIRAHLDNFGGENKVLYLVDALENEDAFYQMDNFSLKKQGGYYLYYESNESMKNYMLSERPYDLDDDILKEETLHRDAAVLRNYKKMLQQKKLRTKTEEKRHRPFLVAGAVALFAITVTGSFAVYKFPRTSEIRSVFSPDKKNDFMLEEMTTELQNTEEQTEAESTEQGTEESTEDRTEEYMSTASNDSYENTIEDNSESEENDTYNIEETETTTASEDNPIFSGEEPDEVEPAWNYIGNYYTVQRGDTLEGISKKIFQTDAYVSKIAEKNGIMNINQIYPGQILYIPEMND